MKVNGKIISYKFIDLLSQQVREAEIKALCMFVGELDGGLRYTYAVSLHFHVILFEFYWFCFGFIPPPLAIRSPFLAVFYYLLSSCAPTMVIFGLSMNSIICFRHIQIPVWSYIALKKLLSYIHTPPNNINICLCW